MQAGNGSLGTEVWPLDHVPSNNAAQFHLSHKYKHTFSVQLQRIDHCAGMQHRVLFLLPADIINFC
jgi:hypothetical protein